jgi:hypothetical protein
MAVSLHRDKDCIGTGVLGVLTRKADALNEWELHIDHLRQRSKQAAINVSRTLAWSVTAVRSVLNGGIIMMKRDKLWQ